MMRATARSERREVGWPSPVVLWSIVIGVPVALVPANVWPLLLRGLGAPIGSVVEAIFLLVFLCWAAGGGPPLTTRVARSIAFRAVTLAPRQWPWSLLAAIGFAVAVHAAIVLLFRLVPFPAEAFRQGYDFSFIPTRPLQWLAVVMSAASAGVCEETGFRGYMQRPIELRHGPSPAIVVSSLLFMFLHLTKGWALIGMVPIVLGAGVLLGLLAWASGSLIPGIIGHTLMDVGLFGFWWTGIGGDFTARPIQETGVDGLFLAACVTLTIALCVVWFAIRRLLQLTPRTT
jgi:membrane protease YdiL (CAAX protease family)